MILMPMSDRLMFVSVVEQVQSNKVDIELNNQSIEINPTIVLLVDRHHNKHHHHRRMYLEILLLKIFTIKRIEK